MVTYSRWTVWASILACIVAVALSLPNVLPHLVVGELLGGQSGLLLFADNKEAD